jgi:hypothetical protein
MVTFADSHNKSNRWKNHFFQLLFVHSVNDVRQAEIHRSEPLLHDPSPFVAKIAIANLKKYKSPGCDLIAAELIQAEGEILRSEIHKLIKSISKKEDLLNHWKESIIVPIYKKGDQTVVIIVGYHYYQFHAKFYLISFSQS